jgi:hypothetical protein
MFPSVFEAPAGLPAIDSDLTAGAGLPMFPAADSRRDRVWAQKKANKSTVYYESRRC